MLKRVLLFAVVPEPLMTDSPILASEKLKADPRLQQAKQLIMDAVAEHQAEINRRSRPES